MKQLITFVFLYVISVCVLAQSTFTEHLTKKVSGQGTVNVMQSKRISDLVNGVTQLTPVKATEPAAKVTATNDDTPTTEVSHGTKRVKARGYRIQVYWGGNQNVDRSKAQNAGFKVTSLYPELSAYTSYESPHWRCRIGDFATREDAAAYLGKIRREAGISSAMIVRSEIWIWQ